MPNASELGRYINTGFFLAIGIYLIIYGAKSKILINESEVVASEEEKQHAGATPLGRIAVVAAGFAALIYGIMRLLK